MNLLAIINKKGSNIFILEIFQVQVCKVTGNNDRIVLELFGSKGCYQHRLVRGAKFGHKIKIFLTQYTG